MDINRVGFAENKKEIIKSNDNVSIPLNNISKSHECNIRNM